MEITLEASWDKALGNYTTHPSYVQLLKRVKHAYQEKDIWPKADRIFSAFDYCPFEKVKVVILGQDPYPTPGHAHGLCFSVPSSVQPLAKSLQNIVKEIQSDLGIQPPANGNLEHWAKQGVFLLNTILTVEAYQPNSHKKIGWEDFTDKVIYTLSAHHQGLIFILWGAQAQGKTHLIDQNKHYLLKSPHPSPLSAYRGFFGSKPFSKTNELLALQNKSKINW